MREGGGVGDYLPPHCAIIRVHQLTDCLLFHGPAAMLH